MHCLQIYTYQSDWGCTLVKTQVNASFFLVGRLTLALQGACSNACLFALLELRVSHRSFISSTRYWRGLSIVFAIIGDGLFSIINNVILIAFTSLSCGSFSLVCGSLIGLRFSFFCNGCSLIRFCRIISLSLRSLYNSGINGTLYLTFCSLATGFCRVYFILLFNNNRSGSLGKGVGGSLRRCFNWLFSNRFFGVRGDRLRGHCLYCWLWLNSSRSCRCFCRYCISSRCKANLACQVPHLFFLVIRLSMWVIITLTRFGTGLRWMIVDAIAEAILVALGSLCAISQYWARGDQSRDWEQLLHFLKTFL